MRRFVEEADRGRWTLLPECLDDFIDENNPVRVVDVFVDALDLAENALRAASVNEDINDAITGHSGGNAVARGYGWKDMVRHCGFLTLSEAVEKVRPRMQQRLFV
jgi:hypothetical protein